MLQALTLLPKSPFLQVSSPSAKSLNRPAPLPHKADTFHASSTQRTGSILTHLNAELLLQEGLFIDYYYNRLAPLKTDSLERVLRRNLPDLIKSGGQALISVYPGGAKALKTPDYTQLLLHLGSLKTATGMLWSDHRTKPLQEYQTHLAKVVKLLEHFSDYEKAHEDLRAKIQEKIPAIKKQQAEGKNPLVLLQAEAFLLNSPKELSLAYIPDLLTLDSRTFSKRMEEKFARSDVEEEKRRTNKRFIQLLEAWRAKMPEGLTLEDNPFSDTYIPLPENSPTKTRLLDPHTQALLEILERNGIPYAFVPKELKYCLKEVLTDSEVVGSNFTLVPDANDKVSEKAHIPMVNSKHPTQIGFNLFANGMTGGEGGTYPMYKGVLYMPEFVPNQGFMARRPVQMSDLVYLLRKQGQDVPLVIGSSGFSAGVPMANSISPPTKTW
jgi:hypothetical protein